MLYLKAIRRSKTSVLPQRLCISLRRNKRIRLQARDAGALSQHTEHVLNPLRRTWRCFATQIYPKISVTTQTPGAPLLGTRSIVRPASLPMGTERGTPAVRTIGRIFGELFPSCWRSGRWARLPGQLKIYGAFSMLLHCACRCWIALTTWPCAGSQNNRTNCRLAGS